MFNNNSSAGNGRGNNSYSNGMGGGSGGRTPKRCGNGGMQQ